MQNPGISSRGWGQIYCPRVTYKGPESPDGISQHAVAAGERRWPESPMRLWTMRRLLFPHSLLPSGSPAWMSWPSPPFPQGRVWEGTVTWRQPSPCPTGTWPQGKPPASALREGDLPLTWALSISVWDVKAVTSLSLLFSLSCRPRGEERDEGPLTLQVQSHGPAGATLSLGNPL